MSRLADADLCPVTLTLPCSQECRTHHSGHTSHYHLLQGTRGCAKARLMSRFADALANANARRSPCLARKSVKSTANARRSLVLAYVPPSSGIPPAWKNTVKVVYCWVLAGACGYIHGQDVNGPCGHNEYHCFRSLLQPYTDRGVTSMGVVTSESGVNAKINGNGWGRPGLDRMVSPPHHLPPPP